jgi:H2-forming N5,N10-methylenetetrahydromethanopterin dehydrogenase-like enzyme
METQKLNEIVEKYGIDAVRITLSEIELEKKRKAMATADRVKEYQFVPQKIHEAHLDRIEQKLDRLQEKVNVLLEAWGIESPKD